MDEDKTPIRVEWCAKLELVRALVQPSAAERLPSRERPGARESRRHREGPGGEDLFERYRFDHPRQQLAALVPMLKDIGDLDFFDRAQKLVEIMRAGVGTSESGEKLGFGQWGEEVEKYLKTCLGVSFQFCCCCCF